MCQSSASPSHVYCAEVFSSPMVYEVSELASIIQRSLPISRQRKFLRQDISTLCVNSGANVETLIVKFNLEVCLVTDLGGHSALASDRMCSFGWSLVARLGGHASLIRALRLPTLPRCHRPSSGNWSICVAPLNVKIIDAKFLYERGAAADLLFSYSKDHRWSQRKDRPPRGWSEHTTRRLDASTGGRAVRQSPQRRHSNWNPCARSSELSTGIVCRDESPSRVRTGWSRLLGG